MNFRTQRRIAKVFREFPFIGDFVGEKEVYEAAVSIVRKEFLGIVPRGKDFIADGADCGIAQGRVYLFAKEGSLICKVGGRLRKWWNPVAWLRRKETIGDAIGRLPDPSVVFYALAISPLNPIWGMRKILICMPLGVFLAKSLMNVINRKGGLRPIVPPFI